ncbi:MAG: hypothetical protein E6Q97_19040 [Desulfurellales bacterium]|nr:MAG: hypothetical protein E6Q97_19040 [Desulfurellales bacterium]
MNQTTDHDASNPEALAQAVHAYLHAADRDEADIALEAALLKQGVMTPDETVNRIEQGAFGEIVIFFDHDGFIVIFVFGDDVTVTRS